MRLLWQFLSGKDPGMADDPMWCVVMFDLPTKTKQERREYQAFRNMLLDNGFVRTQYSIYAKFSPSGVLSQRTIKAIKVAVPPAGEIRILHVSDKQWASTIRFYNAVEEISKEKPDQLSLF